MSWRAAAHAADRLPRAPRGRRRARCDARAPDRPRSAPPAPPGAVPPCEPLDPRERLVGELGERRTATEVEGVSELVGCAGGVTPRLVKQSPEARQVELRGLDFEQVAGRTARGYVPLPAPCAVETRTPERPWRPLRAAPSQARRLAPRLTRPRLRAVGGWLATPAASYPRAQRAPPSSRTSSGPRIRNSILCLAKADSKTVFADCCQAVAVDQPPRRTVERTASERDRRRHARDLPNVGQGTRGRSGARGREVAPCCRGSCAATPWCTCSADARTVEARGFSAARLIAFLVRVARAES